MGHSDPIVRARTEHDRYMIGLRISRGLSVMERLSDIRQIRKGITPRVSQDVLCPKCGYRLKDHPNLAHYTHLTRLCSGALVEL